MSLNVLLISDVIIKDRTSIHGNIDPKLLYPEIKTAQDMYIHPILGSTLFNKMVTLVNTSGVTGDYKTLLDNYIVDPLMYYTLASLPVPISYQFWNKGVIRKQGDLTELPSMSELIDLANHYRIRAEWYAERLTKYLKQNATTTVLPEYLEYGNSLETIIPSESNFTMPIYLGEGHECVSLDKNNCNCNEQKYQ